MYSNTGFPLSSRNLPDAIRPSWRLRRLADILLPMDDAYTALADALDRLPNGYPRTESGSRSRYSASSSPRRKRRSDRSSLGEATSPEEVAARTGAPLPRDAEVLLDLARRGLRWPGKDQPGNHFPPRALHRRHLRGAGRARSTTSSPTWSRTTWPRAAPRASWARCPRFTASFQRSGSVKIRVDPALRRREGSALERAGPSPSATASAARSRTCWASGSARPRCTICLSFSPVPRPPRPGRHLPGGSPGDPRPGRRGRRSCTR